MWFIGNIAKLKTIFTISAIEIVYIFKISKVSTNCSGNWIKNEMWESN